MFRDREFFSSLLPATGKVILGDGKTSLPIEGVGTVKCLIGSNELTIENVQCIPTLSESIYSLFLHVKLPQHGINSSFESGLFLTFPTFNTQAIIGKDDLYLNAVPMLPETFDVPFSTSSFHRLSENTVCRNISEFQKEVLHETDQLDNLLFHLRQYYDTIKTKRQLQFEVPAGFREASIHQRERNSYRLSLQSNAPLDLSSLNIDDAPLDKVDSSHDIEQSQETSLNFSTSNEIPESNINTNSSTDTVPIPIIRSVDKPSSSIPNMLTVSEDFLRASLGFRRIDTIKKHFSDLYCPNIRLDTTPADAVLNLGDLATLNKKNRNTNPVPRPSGFGQVMHMDICFWT
jgi:hypothetical protein